MESNNSPKDTPLRCLPLFSATYTHTDTHSNAPQSLEIDRDLLRGGIKTTLTHTAVFFFLLPTRSAAFFLLSFCLHCLLIG